MRTQTLTLLLSDLQGYTARQARSSRADQARDLALHERLLRPVFAKFDGTVVKTMGDAFLVRFESPTNAVLAAVQVHKQLERHNQSLEAGESALRVRIGIATGEVAVDEAGDVFGDAVNLAARLQSSAEPGAVWLAESTFLSMNRNEVQAFEVGARVFQGVPNEVKVYRVLDAWLQAQPALSAAELQRAVAPIVRMSKQTRQIVIWSFVALFMLGGLIWLFVRAGGDERSPQARFQADQNDVASADAWLRAETEQLYRAEREGTMTTVYREGRVAQLLLDQAPALGERASYRTLRLVYLLANEPLGPEVPQLCLATVRDLPQLHDDAAFVALLRATVEYAQKDPAAQTVYQQALQRIEKR
jgi:class 3 adenylate cyclase